MPGYIRHFLDNQVREVTRDWHWTEVHTPEISPHYALWDRDDALVGIVRTAGHAYVIDGRSTRYETLSEAQVAAEQQAAFRILNETPEQRRDRLMDATERAVQKHRYHISQTPAYRQGDTAIRRILDHTLSELYSTNPPASKPQALHLLREVIRDHQAFISTGQNYSGTAWQDPNYTAGARHGLTRYYLETKKELGLAHLPEHTQTRDKRYGFSAGTDM